MSIKKTILALAALIAALAFASPAHAQQIGGPLYGPGSPNTNGIKCNPANTSNIFLLEYADTKNAVWYYCSAVNSWTLFAATGTNNPPGSLSSTIGGNPCAPAASRDTLYVGCVQGNGPQMSINGGALVAIAQCPTSTACVTGGTGTVTSISCVSGCTVANPTTTPAITVTASGGTVTSVTGLPDNLTCTSPTTTPSCSLGFTFAVVPVLTANMKAGTADAYAALQAAINASITNGGEVSLPIGTYKTSAGLVANSISFKMHGATSATTSISASGTGYTTLVIGSGSVTNQSPSGYLTDIDIEGGGLTLGTVTGSIALQISGIPNYSIARVVAGNADICFDAVNNDFLSQWENIRTYQYQCNVGLYLRTGGQSGSDLNIYNPALVGYVAAVSIAGGGGGYHFWGGQIGTDNNITPNDDSGGVTMGKDYLTGDIGSSSADFHGTSFEGVNYAWAFRIFGASALTTYNISINTANGSFPALGVYKNTLFGCGQVAFHDTAISGFFSNNDSGSPLIELTNVSTDQSPPTYHCGNVIEEGTYVSGSGAPTIHGTQTWVNSMFVQSGLNNYGLISNTNGVNVGGQTLTVGGNNNLSGVLALNGGTSGTATINGPAVAGTSTNPFVLSNVLQVPAGTCNNPGYGFSSDSETGLWASGSGSMEFCSGGNVNLAMYQHNTYMYFSGVAIWNNSGGSMDTGISRDSAGVIDIGNGNQGDTSGTTQAAKYNTSTNCSSAASPAVCGSAAAGSVALPTGTNPTLVVNSSAVTANSQIILTVDESLGTKLSVTCNTALSTLLNPVVTARSAGVSFTFTIGAIIASNPACVSYSVIN